MAPPIRFVLAVPLETADAAEATGSVGSSGGRPTEAAGVKGPAHAPGTAPMPRLLGALCLADFKVGCGRVCPDVPSARALGFMGGTSSYAYRQFRVLCLGA